MAEEAQTDATAEQTEDQSAAAATDQSAADGADAAGKAADEGGAKAADDWRAGIQDEKLRDHAGRFTSLDDLVKANLDSRQKLSKAIVPPGKDAPDEEVAAYRKAMGIPDSVDGYAALSVKPEHLDDETFKSEGVQASLKSFGDAMLKAGAPQEAVTAGLDWYWAATAAVEQANVEADKTFAAESEAQLKKEWGDEFDKNKAHADNGLRQVAERAGVDIEALRSIETKDGRFLLDRPEFSRMFAAIGREMGEGNLGGVLTEGERASMDSEIENARAKAAEAQAKGNSKDANKWYQEEQRLLARRDGDNPIIGAGRAA